MILYERDEIERLIGLREEDLYRELALNLPECTATMYGYGAIVQMGRQAFQRLRKKLYVKICHENQFCSKLDDPQFKDEVTLVITIADLIASATIGASVPAILLATIIVRIGVRKFCQNHITETKSEDLP